MNDMDNMNNMNNEFLYLIANPMKKKKTYVYENTDDELLLLLQKKYKNYHIDEDTMAELFKMIDDKLLNDKINKISNKIVSEIFENILSEYP